MARPRKTGPAKPRKKGPAPKGESGAGAKSYTHPGAEAPVRPDVGVHAQFRKKKPPKTYRYDSSLSPSLEWDENPAREQGEALIRKTQPRRDSQGTVHFSLLREFHHVRQ